MTALWLLCLGVAVPALRATDVRQPALRIVEPVGKVPDLGQPMSVSMGASQGAILNPLSVGSVENTIPMISPVSFSPKAGAPGAPAPALGPQATITEAGAGKGEYRPLESALALWEQIFDFGAMKRGSPQTVTVGDLPVHSLEKPADAGVKRLRDSAVELELPIQRALNLLTTKDGTVGSLLGVLPGPESLVSWAKEHVPGGKLYNASWDKLTYGQRIVLLRYATEQLRTDFFADRTIPRMKVKDKVLVKFKEETVLLGKTYQPGWHMVEISKYLGGPVEYREPFTMKEVGGVELHLRLDIPAGQLSNEAWKLLDLLRIKRNHQHVHVVAPLPMEALKADPALQSAVMADFFRRVNLAAEMVTLIHHKGTIKTREKVRDNGKTARLFGPLTDDKLRRVQQVLNDKGRGQSSPVDQSLRMAWVGFQGSEKYDQPGLYGLEYRAIAAGAGEATTRRMLNQIQKMMLADSYGVPKEKVRRWMRWRLVETGQLVPDLPWYNRSWSELRGEAPKDVAKAARPWPWSSWKWLEKLSDGHDELKMLFYDWSQDPLVFEDQQLKMKIRDEQIRAIGRLRAGEQVGPVIRGFLKKSGLYRRTFESLGFKTPGSKP